MNYLEEKEQEIYNDKMYELFKNAMANQDKCIEYLSSTVEKITTSNESVMLLLDETNRRTQEHADRESANWRKAIIWCIGLICATFLGVVAIYFLTPWESVSTSISSSTSISEYHSKDKNDTDKEDKTNEEEKKKVENGGEDIVTNIGERK